MANAVQKVFRLLLGGVELMHEFAAFDEAEFQLRERPQFLETFLAQARRFLGRRAQRRVEPHLVGPDLGRCLFDRIERLPAGDHQSFTIW